MLLAVLKALLFGIVEGVTEWLPISSTGHIILLDAFVPLGGSPAFYDLFEILIQLGAILAVIFLYFRQLNPLTEKTALPLWGKVLVGVLPSAVVGALLDERLDALLRQTPVKSTNLNTVVVAAALMVYGILFMLLERRKPALQKELTLPRAAGIGLFQCLALIPGTSRSGATIMGGLLLGVPREKSAEFSFFLAIPTMLGASLLKLWQFRGIYLTPEELVMLLLGCVTAFFVSLPVIRGLMDFVKSHTFAPFGIYRILLGALVLGYFLR